MSPRSWRMPDRGPLAQTRERFLVRESVEPSQVRDPILASWWRSRDWNVPADRIELSYVRDPDMDTPLTRSAMPVLRHLRENVDGQPISVILTDATGVVLTRLTADHDLERHLDGVKLAPGFSYAEELVGTNGIGTALEGGQPAHVFGHEHYAENLEDLACAGVPIHHPITGKTIGAVDLTCWRKDADPLLVALVKTAADQITQALLTDSSAAGTRTAAGVPACLQADQRHRARAQQRSRDDERTRPPGAGRRRPGGAARRRRARHWGQAGPARWRWSCRPG